jgi:hypothetical protein
MKSSLSSLIALILIVISSCSSGNDNTKNKFDYVDFEKQKNELQKEKLKLEKERKELAKLRLENEKEEKKRKEEIIKLEQNFPENSAAHVKVKKAYFHSHPDQKFKSTSKFLVSGDYIEIMRTKNGFAYIEFLNNDANKTTAGWIDLNDLEPYESGC